MAEKPERRQTAVRVEEAEVHTEAAGAEAAALDEAPAEADSEEEDPAAADRQPPGATA